MSKFTVALAANGRQETIGRREIDEIKKKIYYGTKNITFPDWGGYIV